MTQQDVCAAISGIACVLGISLSVINAWLMALSLVVSIVAGLATLLPLIRKVLKESKEPDCDEP